MIVIIISTIVILSLTLAPNRGLVWSYLRNRKNQKSIGEDQILTNLYHLYVNHDNEGHCHDLITISPDANLKQQGKDNIRKQLKDLKEKGFTMSDSSDRWCITDSGIDYVENYFKEGEE